MTNIIGNFNSGRVIPVVKGIGYGTAFSGQLASQARNKEINSLNRLSMSMNPWLSEIANQQLNSTWLAYQENQMLKSADSGELPGVALAQLKRTLQPMEQRKQVTQETQTESIGTQSLPGGVSSKSKSQSTPQVVSEFLSKPLIGDLKTNPESVLAFLEGKVQEMERSQDIASGGGDISGIFETAKKRGAFEKKYQTGMREDLRVSQSKTAVEGVLQSLIKQTSVEKVESILQEKGYQGLGKPSVRGGSFAQAGGSVLGSEGRLAQLQATQTQGGDSTQLSGVVSNAPLSSGDLGSVTASPSPQLPIASEAQLLQQGVMPSRFRKKGRVTVTPIESPSNLATQIQQDITQQVFLRARNRNVGRISSGYVNIAPSGGGAEAMSEENIFSQMFAGGGGMEADVMEAYASGEVRDPRTSIDPKVIANLPEEIMSIEEKNRRMLELFEVPMEIPHSSGLPDLVSEELREEFGDFLRRYAGRYPRTGLDAWKAFMKEKGMKMVSASGGTIQQGQGGLKF